MSSEVLWEAEQWAVASGCPSALFSFGRVSLAGGRPPKTVSALQWPLVLSLTLSRPVRTGGVEFLLPGPMYVCVGGGCMCSGFPRNVVFQIPSTRDMWASAAELGSCSTFLILCSAILECCPLHCPNLGRFCSVHFCSSVLGPMPVIPAALDQTATGR